MSGWFSLEVVYAKKGDALILHYGTKASPYWILIDGGHNGVYESFLKPRLEELRLIWPSRLKGKGLLPLEKVIVSHADADHLAGVLDLTDNMRRPGHGMPAPVVFRSLWFNGFEDLIANPVANVAAADLMGGMAETAGADNPNLFDLPAVMREDPDLRAVVASTRQGRQLLGDAKGLGISVNGEYGHDLVMRGGSRPSVTKLPGGLTLTVVCPDKKRVDQLRARWAKDLKKILEKEGSMTEAASFADASPFNLSSIVILAKRGGKSMLLTGDARGDDIIEGLAAQKLLDAKGKIAVDVFKLPHHGSDRNVKDETFRDITAKHYVVSANGEHDNPEPVTLDMLVAGRRKTRRDAFTLHLSFPREAFKLISDEAASRTKKLRNQKDALEAVDRWLRTKRPANMSVVYRQESQRSLALDLAGESVFD
jgi:hypothetical protein